MRKLFTILCVLLLAVPLVAQQRTGNIYGKILDEEGSPLPGVTVTLTGSRVGAMTTITNAEGVYRFLSLAVGSDYVVKAELDGFNTNIQEGIVVEIGVNTQVAITLEQGTLEEEVTVVAATPVVDVKKTTVSTNVNQEMLQSLPTARDPWVVLQMAASVMVDRENVGGSESGQQSSFVAKGSDTKDQNVYSMDGVVITDPAAIGGSPTYFDFDAFEEMNITTGGADVTVQTGGVALNMVTRRGGNQLSMGGRIYMTDQKFQADNLTDEYIAEGIEGTTRVRDIKDIGLNFGLPVIKDKAWFWMSYGRQDIKTTIITGANDDTILENYAAKLNFQLIPQNRFEAFLHIGKKEKFGRSASATYPSGFHQRGKYHFGTPIFKLQDEHMFGNDLFVSAKFAFSDAGFGLRPMIDEDVEHLRIYDITTDSEHNSYYWYVYSRPVYQYNILLNYFNDNLLGASHEVKFGVEYANRNQAYESSSPGNMRAWENYNEETVDITGDGLRDIVNELADPTYNGVDFSNLRRWRVFRGGYGNDFVKAFSAYISDTISFGRFNLTLGLRYDLQKPQIEPYSYKAVVDEGLGSAVWENYVTSRTTPLIDQILPGLEIAAIENEYLRYSVLSPRFGLSWDATGDGRTIIKLSGSMYGDFMGTGTNGRLRPRGTGGTLNFWWVDNGDMMVDYTELYWRWADGYAPYRVFDDAGNFIGDWDDARSINEWSGYDYQNPGQYTESATTVDPNFNSPRTMELILTAERELMPDFGIALDISYRRYDMFTWRADYYPEDSHVRSQEDYMIAGYIPDQIGEFSTGEAAGKPWYVLAPGPHGAATDYEYYTNWDTDRYNDYWGFDFRATKRLSNRWMMNGSFSYQIQNAHYGSQGYADPTDIWALEGQPYSALIGGASGKISQYVFSRWLFKVQGLYQLPWDFDVSFTLSAREGSIIRNQVHMSDSTLPNPNGRGRNDVDLSLFGSERLDPLVNMSFRLQKVVRFSDNGRLYLMADIFNPFNFSTMNRRYQRDLGRYYANTGNFSSNSTNYLANEILNPRLLRLGIRFQF